MHSKETGEAIYKRLAEAAKSGADTFRKELGAIGKEIEQAAKQGTLAPFTAS